MEPTEAMPDTLHCDVLVVGAGNAALCAALAARESGADVLVLERAPFDDRGGNSRYTAGAIRFAFDGVEDYVRVVPDLSPSELANADFGRYTRDEYFDDMARVTQYRAHPDMVETLVNNSLETVVWMNKKGVKFNPSYGRQAFKVDGKFKFWGGLAAEVTGGGPGLIDNLTSSCERQQIRILYDARAHELLFDGARVGGARVRQNGGNVDIHAKSTVLAAGD
jgi:tricarballylate dehydrogenase